MKNHPRLVSKCLSLFAIYCIASSPSNCKSIDTTDSDSARITLDINNGQMKLTASRDRKSGEEQSLISSGNTMTVISKNSSDVSILGQDGLLEFSLPKCNRDSIRIKDCSKKEFLSQFTNLEEIFFDHSLMDSDGKSFLKCNPILSIKDFKMAFTDPTKAIPDVEIYLKSSPTCKDSSTAGANIAKAILQAESRYSQDYLEKGTSSLTKSKKDLADILLYLKYMESPNPNLKPFQLICGKNGSDSSVDFSTKPPTITMAPNSTPITSQVHEVIKKFFLSNQDDHERYKDALNDDTTLIIGSPTTADTTRTAMASNATAAVSGAGTQAVPTAARISVAQLQEAVRSNRPESKGIIAAFTKQAIGDATRAVSQIPEESFKAVGGSSASFFAASQRALAEDSKITVSSGPSRAPAPSASATSIVSGKINVGAGVTPAGSKAGAAAMVRGDADAQLDANSGETGKTKSRAPASAPPSARGKVASDAARANVGATTDGVNLSGTSGGGASDPQGLQKKIPAGNQVSSSNPFVRDLMMDKEKSKNLVKSLKGEGRKGKTAKKCNENNIRVFDAKNNLLCEGKSENPATFKETADGSLIRLK